MRKSRFGGFLIGTGAAVGVAAVVGLVTGFEPSQLPAALLDIAVYKLTFVAAGGLLAAGAIVRRYTNRQEPAEDRLVDPDPRSVAPARVLPDASLEADLSRRADARPNVEVPRSPER